MPEIDENEVALDNDQEQEKEVLNNDDSERVAIEKLQAQLKEAEQKRIEAEHRAFEAQKGAEKAHDVTHSARIDLISSAIYSKNQERAALKAEYRKALEEGDYNAAAEVNDQIASIAAELMQLNEGKRALEESRQAPRNGGEINKVEEFVKDFTPRSADWIRRNPEYVTDKDKHRRMISSHHVAVAEGLQPDTDEYFQKIEELLGLREKERPKIQKKQETDEEVEEEASSSAAKIVSRRDGSERPPPAAPVNRRVPGEKPNSRAVTIRLTADQREAAAASGLTEEEYARNLIALRKDGRIS